MGNATVCKENIQRVSSLKFSPQTPDIIGMQAQNSLAGLIENYAATASIQLPAFDATALRIQKEVAKAQPDARLIERLIVADESLTEQVLRVSNSSFYKGLAQVATVRDAIIRLGIKEVSNIVTLVALQRNFRSRQSADNRIMGKLWRHSVASAIGASWLASQTGFEAMVHETFTAGLLHDIGKLYVLIIIDDMIAGGEIKCAPSDAVMNEVMENLHADQGLALMRHWSMPEKYCQVARDHHEPEFNCHNFLLVLVRLANQMCHKMGIGLKEDDSIDLETSPEATRLKLSQADLVRLEVRLEDSQVVAP